MRQVVEPDGSLRLNAAGRPTMRTLLFPAEHATHVTNWNTIGMRGTASEGYTLDNLFVPEAFSATREDPTLRRLPGRLYAFPQQGLYPVGVAGVACGIARAMLDAFIDLATRKTPRGLGRLADNAVVQSNVARMQARLDAGRAYAVETLADIWATADDIGVIDVAGPRRVRLACAHAIHEADRGRGLHLQGRRHGLDLSRHRRSNAGSATCTRCRSRSSPAMRISKRPAAFCSASCRRAHSSSNPRRAPAGARRRVEPLLPIRS